LENSRPHISGASNRFLLLLKTKGTLPTAAIAAELGMTAEGARLQLLKLEAEGLLAAAAESKGVGRPTQVWTLTQKGYSCFPDTHARLTVQLIDTIKEKLGPDVLHTVIDAHEKTTSEKYAAALKGITNLTEKIARLTEIKRSEGYLAEWAQDEEGFTLIENHCPIHDAAATCNGFCKAELNSLKKVLGRNVSVSRTSHILSGERQCIYRIVEKNTAGKL
jgi:predicted ArsR family transcriptional regulator